MRAGTREKAIMPDRKGRRVAVIGGGPGGAQCARRLAEAGMDVTVFEPRVRFEKACGGGIPARGLERYPFLIDAGLAGKVIRECLVVAPSGREARFPLGHPLFVFSRGTLHSFMLSRAATAGARVVQARVVSFRNAGPGAD
jgi:flavin-dependent dehydrogenase